MLGIIITNLTNLITNPTNQSKDILRVVKGKNNWL